ncbi:MAG: F0F1 ATP synthase subunit epsilon [Deltaproteobacteria bacterium]|jgi:F-type H+-transporting ATPase subunit epsilon|nr:F0F1 ATP synthase subunit epsilon [Deltaproteobacteria bacterium]
MANTLQFDIVTPDRVVFSGPVEYFGAPGLAGDFGVYPGHAAMLAALTIGCVHFTFGDKQHYAFVNSGFAEVSATKATILAESAELAENIDEARASAAKERAEARLREHGEELDLERANASLRRAISRLNAVKFAN